MKIVFTHSGILPVVGYGGIERILFWHMKELARLNHEVILIGHKDSQVAQFGIKLIPILENQHWEDLIPLDCDIIHLSFNHVVKGSIPTISTVHGNGKVGEIFHKNSVFVSKKHAEIHGSQIFIHNAIDLDEYPYQPKLKRAWIKFLFLAKASWRVKNLKHAVSACRKNKKHLHIIGGRWWGLSRYIHSHGIIGGDKKMSLIQNADCMLFPVRWHEPFGIAVIEAMSQGVPVIGSHYGSLPELITKDVGFIAHNFDELDALLAKDQSHLFNPDHIRKHVEDHFSISSHAEKYLELYQKVIRGELLNSIEPQYKLTKRAEDLLPY
jgi:glycosyltransferase involved in cell wall biosynthesis